MKYLKLYEKEDDDSQFEDDFNEDDDEIIENEPIKRKAKKYQTMKVFDCQNMPKDVRRSFFDYSDHIGNDCYINWGVGPNPNEYKDDEFADDEDLYNKQQRIVDKWLIENGAEPNEEVIISHWW